MIPHLGNDKSPGEQLYLQRGGDGPGRSVVRADRLRCIHCWAHSVFAWGLLAAVAGSLIALPMSLNADPEQYPASWQLILASIKAGVTKRTCWPT